MKIIVNVLVIAFFFLGSSISYGVRSEPQPNKPAKSLCPSNYCDKSKPNFWMPGCKPFYQEGNFDGSIVEIIEPPSVKLPNIKYVREYKGDLSFAYSAEYVLPSGQKMKKSLTHREVDLKCIRKNGVPRYCCTATFPKAFGRDKEGIDRIVFQSTGIRCGYGEALRVEWIKGSDENEKAIEGLEKMGMIIKGKIVVRKAKGFVE